MAEPARLAIKIDVDTDRGTREGIAPLARAMDRHSIRGTFLFSLGPDNTGRAIRRVFRPGFFSKVSRIGRTSITVKVEVYAERFRAQGQYIKVTEASVTYVAIDDNGQPREIPKD